MEALMMYRQDTFDHHDGDNKGFLTKTELRESVRTLGHNPTEQELWRLLAQVWTRVMCHVLNVTCHEADVQVDVDHDGTLNFEEFSNLTASIRHKKDPCGDLKMCWRVLGIYFYYLRYSFISTYFLLYVASDPSGRGKVPVKSVKRQLLCNNETSLSESEVLEIFQEYEDTDDMDESSFINAVTNIKLEK